MINIPLLFRGSGAHIRGMGQSGWISGCAAALCIFVVSAATAAEPVIAGPLRVIDGDTLDIAGQKIRLHGIDAPEQDQTCRSGAGVEWACGAWVTDQVKARFDGQSAACLAVDTDRYGRMVASCKVGGADLADMLVRDGLAFAYQRYSMAYVATEKLAAVAGAGLHGHVIQKPAAFRKRDLPAQTHPANCNIKGNISASGRIFHVPGQRDYAQTRITTAKGERWFCSVSQARAAGWRAARR